MIRLVKCLGIFAFSLLVIPCLACNTRRWEAGKEIRTEKVNRTASYFQDREAEGPERIDRTMQTIEHSQMYHEDHLARTGKLVRTEWDSDKKRWSEERPKRRAFASRYWHAKPETIPTTWAKMVY